MELALRKRCKIRIYLERCIGIARSTKVLWVIAVNEDSTCQSKEGLPLALLASQAPVTDAKGYCLDPLS